MVFPIKNLKKSKNPISFNSTKSAVHLNKRNNNDDSSLDNSNHSQSTTSSFDPLNAYVGNLIQKKDNSIRDSIIRYISSPSRDNSKDLWGDVRYWMESHTPRDLRIEAEMRDDENNRCLLHLACCEKAPYEIIEAILFVAPDTIMWEDKNGWLPIHHSAAHDAPTEILYILAKQFPESLIRLDDQGQTPLHVAIHSQACSANIELLCSTGAAELVDDKDRLPAHCACEVGSTEEVFQMLIKSYPESLKAVDEQGRTVLHIVMGNAHRPTSPPLIQAIVTGNPLSVDTTDAKGLLPLHHLSEHSHQIDKRTVTMDRENYQKCLGVYLNAKPSCTLHFCTAVLNLPSYLRERAMITPTLQAALNKEMTNRIPSAIMMLDFYVLFLLVLLFNAGVKQSINLRISVEEATTECVDPALVEEEATPNSVNAGIIIGLYFCATYYLLREAIQVVGLHSLGKSNVFMFALIIMVYIWTYLMQTSNGDHQVFRFGAAICVGMIWFEILIYFRSNVLAFTVLFSAVTEVLRGTGAFVVGAVVLILSFAQMFVMIFTGTEACQVGVEDVVEEDFFWNVTNGTIVEEAQCDEEEFPFCEFAPSVLNTYNYLLGEVDDTPFFYTLAYIPLFVVYVLLACLILLNIFIRIVEEVYIQIQERAAILFWGNRLTFVTEATAIAHLLGKCSKANKQEKIAPENRRLDKLWLEIVNLFEDAELKIKTFDFWAYFLLRVMAIIMVPLWFLLGIVTAGLLWPRQFRQMIFAQSTSEKLNPDIDEMENRSNQLAKLNQEVEKVKPDVVNGMQDWREDVVQLRESLDDTKEEIFMELSEINDKLANLLSKYQ